MRDVAKASKGVFDVKVHSSERFSPEVVATDQELEIHVFDCCTRSVKVGQMEKGSLVYCPYDGVS